MNQSTLDYNHAMRQTQHKLLGDAYGEVPTEKIIEAIKQFNHIRQAR